MAQTNINIRIDEDLKQQFETFCSNIGMTMTTAFCLAASAIFRHVFSIDIIDGAVYNSATFFEQL